MELSLLLQSLKPDELRFIAERDYGLDAERHLEALCEVVANGGQLSPGEYWYPYEVIELSAHRLVTGHEREFVVCTLLVIAAIQSGHDIATDLTTKFEDRAADYDKLNPEFRESVLSAYAAARL